MFFCCCFFLAWLTCCSVFFWQVFSEKHAFSLSLSLLRSTPSILPMTRQALQGPRSPPPPTSGVGCIRPAGDRGGPRPGALRDSGRGGVGAADAEGEGRGIFRPFVFFSVINLDSLLRKTMKSRFSYFISYFILRRF